MRVLIRRRLLRGKKRAPLPSLWVRKITDRGMLSDDVGYFRVVEIKLSDGRRVEYRFYEHACNPFYLGYLTNEPHGVSELRRGLTAFLKEKGVDTTGRRGVAV